MLRTLVLSLILFVIVVLAIMAWSVRNGWAFGVEPRMTPGTCFSARVILLELRRMEHATFNAFRPWRRLGRIHCCAPSLRSRSDLRSSAPLGGDRPRCIVLKGDHDT
ncbi:MAG: hypothetical protein AB7S41_11365 [Parvibaculaceae bacterium]